MGDLDRSGVTEPRRGSVEKSPNPSFFQMASRRRLHVP
jgi:hypothetical protein